VKLNFDLVAIIIQARFIVKILYLKMKKMKSFVKKVGKDQIMALLALIIYFLEC
jgi:hypothetical protein